MCVGGRWSRAYRRVPMRKSAIRALRSVVRGTRGCKQDSALPLPTRCSTTDRPNFAREQRSPSSHDGHRRSPFLGADEGNRVPISSFAIRTYIRAPLSRRILQIRVAPLVCFQHGAHDSPHMHPIIDELTRDPTASVRPAGSCQRTDYPSMHPGPIALRH